MFEVDKDGKSQLDRIEDLLKDIRDKLVGEDDLNVTE